MPLNTEGQLLDEGRCVGSADCSCVHAGQRYPPGASLSRDCNTWYLGLRRGAWEGGPGQWAAGEAVAGATGSGWAEGEEVEMWGGLGKWGKSGRRSKDGPRGGGRGGKDV